MWDHLLQNLGLGLIAINQGSIPTEGLGLLNKTKDDSIYRHFNPPDHQGLTGVRVRLIDKCYNEGTVKDREAQWPYLL